MTAPAWDTRARLGLAVLFGLSLPLSTAATNLLAGVALLYAVGLGLRRPAALRAALGQPLALLSLGLLGLALLGLVYTPVAPAVALDMLEKYRELLLLPVFLLVFALPGATFYGAAGFLLGCLGVTVASVLVFWLQPGLNLNPDDPLFLTKNRISLSQFLAFSAYLLALWALLRGRWRGWALLLSALVLGVLLFISQGRSGYLLVLGLLLLLCWQLYRWRGLALGALLVALLGGLSLAVPSPMQQRLQASLANLDAYQAGDKATSTALRLDYLRGSLSVLRQTPALGYGTGSFATVYGELAQREGFAPTANPHNEYLLLLIQWGAPGLLLFLALLWAAWRGSAALPPGHACAAQAVVLTMALGCLLNSLLMDLSEGHAFVFALGLLYARWQPEPA